MSQSELTRSKLPHTHERWIAAGLLLLSLALRLYRLGNQCLWYDEAQTLAIARLPWGEIGQRAYRPPLYHFLLHAWSDWVPNNEFWLRLPSALIGAALVPLLYTMARRIYGRKTAWATGLLAAISPTLIAYAQELRMYSLMAFEFTLLLYLLVRLLRQGGKPWLWAALWLTIVASLYTHYFAIPFVLCAVALAALTLAALGRRRDLRRWLAIQGAALIAFIPWLLVILAGHGGTEDYIVAEVLPVLPEVSGVDAFLSQAWLFYTTGPVTSELAVVRWLALGGAIALGATLCALIAGVAKDIWRWRKEGTVLGAESIADLWLLALTLLPWAAAALMYHLRPGVVHPRHLMMGAAPLMLLVGRSAGWSLRLLGAERPRPRAVVAQGWIGGATAVLLAMLFALSYGQTLRDPSLQRADVREMATAVAARANAETVVLLPHEDYAFEYYFQNPAALYRIETRVGDADLLPWLLPRMQGAQRAILVEWVHMHQDPRDLLPWFLQRNGRLVERFWSAERWVSVYELTPTLENPSYAPLEMRVGPLTLTGISLPKSSPADQALAIGLQWRLDEETPRALKASVRLVDDTGHVLANDDRVLLAERATLATDRWRPGTVARNYYLLTPPVGLPPLDYAIQISVYDEKGPLMFTAPEGGVLGSVASVGTVSLAPAEAFPPSLPSEITIVPMGLDLLEGLRLEGYALERETARAGESVAITLYWRALTEDLLAQEAQVTLLAESGEKIGSQRGHAAQGRYPMSRWRAGELVMDRRVLRIAPEAVAGQAEVIVQLGSQKISLGSIQVEANDRLFSLPPVPYTMNVSLGGLARLAGYGLEPTNVLAGGPLTVTLYWEALPGQATPGHYVVFVHLVSPEGQIIAQHDGPPAGGQWPTETWVPGQVIVDPHLLQFHDPGYRGPATLAVGLYDPASLQRLATPQGQDHVALPSVVTLQ